MPLFLLDRDGVVVVNRKDNIKSPAGLKLIAGAAEAIARLTGAGFDVAICTNQPEVARGAMSHDELDRVHDALTEMLAAKGGRVASILCCICERKTPRMKPAAGMLREALARFGARAADTPFVGDQVEDLKADADCYGQPLGVRCRSCERRVLVPLDKIGAEAAT